MTGVVVGMVNGLFDLLESSEKWANREEDFWASLSYYSDNEDYYQRFVHLEERK